MRRARSSSGPDLEPRTVDLVQVAPGVYQAPLGEIDPGAYAVRITQSRPGSTPLGRTVGLVAQTAAEYRQLGANEPFLASVRAAAGGSVIATAKDPWVHDLTTTNRFTDLWPVLLVLALLLWPLDIALRRMSLGRRELAAARGWVGGIGRRRRAAGPRTATAEGMLAASERVRTGRTRAALRAPAEAPPAVANASAATAAPPPAAPPANPTPTPAAAAPASSPITGSSFAAQAACHPTRHVRIRRHDVPPPRRQAPGPRPLTGPPAAPFPPGGSLASVSIPRAVGLGFVALLVAACSYVETGPPAPTPADFPGIAIEFQKRGLHVGDPVSGDAGCNDSVLTPTAISFDISGMDQTTPVKVYLYVFRNRATYERLRSTIDACARSYVTDPENFESVEQSPFVLAGQGPWGTAFEAALRDGIVVAAGTGDNPGLKLPVGPGSSGR